MVQSIPSSEVSAPPPPPPPPLTEIVVELRRHIYVEDTTNNVDDVTKTFAFYQTNNVEL